MNNYKRYLIMYRNDEGFHLLASLAGRQPYNSVDVKEKIMTLLRDYDKTNELYTVEIFKRTFKSPPIPPICEEPF